MDLNEIQKNILKKFMYNEKLKYNQIWNKDICTSSLFDYHFKKLIDDNLISKKDNFYVLTSNGMNLMSNLDGKKIEISKKPVVCSFFVVKKDDKFLLCKRNKQPFINFLGIGGGKLDLGITTEDQAKQELLEETGLKGNCKLKLISEYITRDDVTDDVLHHIIGFYYLFDNVDGELIPDKREGEFLWLGLDELNNYDCFPDVVDALKLIMANKELSYYKNYRRLRDGNFI